MIPIDISMGKPGEPQPGQVYRHFRGSYYRVVAMAQDCEHRRGGPRIVVYCKHKDPNELFTRPIENFLQEMPPIPEFPLGTPRFTLVGR